MLQYKCYQTPVFNFSERHRHGGGQSTGVYWERPLMLLLLTLLCVCCFSSLISCLFTPLTWFCLTFLSESCLSLSLGRHGPLTLWWFVHPTHLSPCRLYNLPFTSLPSSLSLSLRKQDVRPSPAGPEVKPFLTCVHPHLPFPTIICIRVIHSTSVLFFDGLLVCGVFVKAHGPKHKSVHRLGKWPCCLMYAVIMPAKIIDQSQALPTLGYHRNGS